MPSLHERTHPSLSVPGCYACRMSNVHYIGYAESKGLSRSDDKWNQSELARYKMAREEGIQPLSIRRTDEALQWSDENGRPFRGENLARTLYPSEYEHVKADLERPSSEVIQSLRPQVVQDSIDRAQAGES